MRIVRFQASNVRRIRAVEIAPGERINVIAGKNGSGKTSLLEAIHLLGYGRSFRTRRIGEVLAYGEDRLTAFCEVLGADGTRSQVGFEKAGAKSRVRVNGEDVSSSSALARHLPAVFIGPECSRLLEESELRRNVLDWALFHVEPCYLQAYQRFYRALRQRNAALRGAIGPAALDVWDRELARAGEALHALRVEHVDRFTEFACRFLMQLLPVAVELRFSPGWDVERPLSDTLAEQREADRRVGFSLRGPHRADLRLAVRDALARTILSRGESKLLAMGLQLAQGAYFEAHRGEPPVILVDDLGTELDAESRSRFLRALRSLGAQAFITTVADQLEEWSPGEIREADRVVRFHVEQGEFRQVI